MKRLLLAAGALVVLGAAIGLLVWLGRSDHPSASPAASAPVHAPDEVVATVPAPVRPHAGVDVSSDPGSAAPSPSEDAPPTEYTVGGVQVRDHRSGSNKPMDVPPNVHPPEARRIASSLTSAISTQVRAAVRDCATQVPPEARGTTPKVDGLISIEIKNKQATVTKADIQVRDVVGAALEPTRQCIEQKSLGLHAPTDEADLADYGITISFMLP